MHAPSPLPPPRTLMLTDQTWKGFAKALVMHDRREIFMEIVGKSGRKRVCAPPPLGTPPKNGTTHTRSRSQEADCDPFSGVGPLGIFHPRIFGFGVLSFFLSPPAFEMEYRGKGGERKT